MTRQLDQILLDQAARLAQPLIAAGADPDAAVRFATAVGWDLGAIAGVPTKDLAQAFASTAKAFQDVGNLVEQGPADLGTLAKSLAACVDAFGKLRGVAKSWSPSSAGLPADLLETFVEDVLAYLMDAYMLAQVPRLRATLQLIGVYQLVSAGSISRRDNTIVRRAQRRPAWNLNLLVKALTDPPGLVRQLYTTAGGSPQTPPLISDLAGPLLAEALSELGIPSHYGTPGAALDPNLSGDEKSAAQHLLHIRLAIATDGVDAAAAVLGVALGLIQVAGKLTVVVTSRGTLAATRSLGNWSLSATLTGTLQPFVINSSGVTFEGSAAPTQLELTTSASRDPTGDGPMLRLGKEPGTRFDLGGVAFTQKLTVSTTPAVTFLAGVELKQARLFIAAGDGDGFLNAVLPSKPVQLDIPLAIDWSPQKGFVVRGPQELRIDLPLQLDWGPVKVSSLLLSIGEDSAGPHLNAAASGSLSIGPVVATVQRLGISLKLRSGGAGGSFGQLDVGVGFKPPDGIGLALTAPGVNGVGFLDIDTEHHQYLGAIAISVGDVDISAVGVLNTRLPEGSGYSLIVVVSASFPPIELGFGFDLTGVGGLMGVNRTVDVPALQGIARSGGLDQLMFPEDLIHKAPQVAASLAAIFPAALHHFLIGPAVEIEWGTDGILDAEIGILIELTDAGGGISILRIALLGFFHITLPQAEAPVADITLDVLGLLDIPAKTISIDAGMRDSKVAGFTLTGQAALRAGWGAHATFVLALGGFNPAFDAPAGFPLLARIALSLGDDNPRLRFASYFALTPNTLQFGAAADLYASEGPAAVTASLAFDVLIQFKPFGLLVDLTISAAVLFNGSPVLTMNLALHLSGPDPWHVTGKASITVFFATFSVPINVTIGDAPPPQMPQTVSLDKNLTDALADLHNWQIGPPAGGGGVVVRSFDQANKGVHPMASLTVRQHAVPLRQPIDRYGPDLVTPCSYDITKVQLGSQVVADKNITAVTDQFAPAQFITMSDADKLSAPSFEPMEAGVTIGAAGLVLSLTGPATDPQTKVVDMPSTRTYDLLTMDVPDTTPAPPPEPPGPPGPRPGGGGRTRPQLRTPPPPPPTRRQVALPGDLLQKQHAGAAAAVNGADGRGAARFRGPVTGFAVVHPTWAVLGLNLAAQADGRVLRSDLSSMTAARSWVDREVPTAAVQVVYKSERPGAVALARRSSRV